MVKELIGKNIKIITDYNPRLDSIAKIVLLGNDKKLLLLELDSPLVSSNITYKFVVAINRSSNCDINSLMTKGHLLCGVIWVPEDQFNYKDPFDVTWWRGGMAEIATIKLI